MITSQRIGRYGNLCNSMFQFAAVIGMGKKTGLEVAIPHNETYYDPNYGCNNTSIFDGFDIKTPILDLGILNFTKVEFPFHYEDKRVNDFTDMVGYFQSEKYFENAEKEIRNHFKFKKYVKEIIDAKINSGKYPDPSICTSLHIRLGDYTAKRDYHPEQPTSYWTEAVKIINPEKLIIFSDSVEMAKQMFGESNRVIYSEDDNPFAALYHMSLCRNNIICNSTFGWWGAWLGEENKSVEKTIVAPKIWFGRGHAALNPNDIIPDRWLTL